MPPAVDLLGNRLRIAANAKRGANTNHLELANNTANDRLREIDPVAALATLLAL